MIISKFILPIVAALGIAVGSAGTVMLTKAVTPRIEIPECPACNCPPATEVQLQNFDVNKLNNKKGNFTYSPSLNNVTVKITCADSALLKQLLKR